MLRKEKTGFMPGSLGGSTLKDAIYVAQKVEMQALRPFSDKEILAGLGVLIQMYCMRNNTDPAEVLNIAHNIVKMNTKGVSDIDMREPSKLSLVALLKYLQVLTPMDEAELDRMLRG